MLRHTVALFLFVLASLVLLPGVAGAQNGGNLAVQGMPENPNARLNEMARALDQANQELRSGLITAQRMDHWQARLNEIERTAARVADRGEARVQSVRSLLEALGPRPETGSEPAPVANERGKMNRELERFLALQKQAELILARVDALRRDLLGAQRTRFKERLLTRGPTIFALGTWTTAIKDLSEGVGRAVSVFARAPSQAHMATSWRDALPLNIAVLSIALVVAWPLRSLLFRRCGRDPTIRQPRYMQRLTAAVIEGALRALVPAIAVGAIYIVLRSQGLLVGLVETLAVSVAVAITFFSLVYGLTKAVLAPEAPAWRVIHFTNDCAVGLGRMIVGLAGFFAVDWVLFRLGEALELSRELAIVHNTVVGVVITIVVLRMMSPRYWRRDAGTAAAGTEAAVQAEDTAPPPDDFDEEDDGATAGDIGRPLAVLLTIAIGLTAVAIPVAAALGYAVLSRFLTVRLVLTGVLVASLVLLRGMVHEIVTFALHEDTATGRRVAHVLGLSATGLNRLRFWLLIPTDLILLVGGALLALALWGVSWELIRAWTATLLFGVQLGGITISLVDIAIAGGVFFAALALSRFIQRVMNRQVFKPIRMDVGVRHSLNAAISYTGIVVAILLAIAALGLDLSSLAIIAGALSVGIGFGLQTIVNNFVSGLILLIERPVKVGDWVVVGAHEGFVKKINVRATELETFDRSYVIVPNAEFVSSAVTNWTHRNRQCRLIIRVRVPYGCDTQRVHDLLMGAARAHRDILRWPAPHVLFTDFGESGLVFELRCYARDVDHFLTAPSELRFTIDSKLREAGIHVPHPARDIHIRTVPWPEGTRDAEDPRARDEAGVVPSRGATAAVSPSATHVPEGRDIPDGIE